VWMCVLSLVVVVSPPHRCVCVCVSVFVCVLGVMEMDPRNFANPARESFEFQRKRVLNFLEKYTHTDTRSRTSHTNVCPVLLCVGVVHQPACETVSLSLSLSLTHTHTHTHTQK